MFLGYVSHELPNRPATLWYAWDHALVKRFFARLRTATNPSSAVNFYSALACIRLYMRLNGNRPEDYLNILTKFQLLMNAAMQERSIYIAESKDSSTKEVGLLRAIFLRIYHSESKWLKLHKIFKRLENSGTKVTNSELTFLNGFLGFLLLCQNGMRSGTLDQLESEPTANALTQALGEFRHQHPDEDVQNASRRLDRTKMEPAIIRVPVGTKKGKPEDVCILAPRDQEALLSYHRFIRANPPSPVTTSKFFFNSRGTNLGKDVLYYLRQIAQKEGIKAFTVNTLRHAFEVENALDQEPLDRSIVSAHLGHSKLIAEKFYLVRDKRHAVQASNRLLFFLENEGEKDEKKVSVKSGILLFVLSVLTVALEY